MSYYINDEEIINDGLTEEEIIDEKVIGESNMLLYAVMPNSIMDLCPHV